MKTFRKIVLLLLVIVTFYVVYLIKTPKATKQEQQQAKIVTDVQKDQQNQDDAELRKALAKQKLQADIQAANEFVKEIDNSPEFVLLTVSDVHKEPYDANPNGYGFMEWADKCKIEVYLKYTAKYILPAKSLNMYVENDGIVSINYNVKDIYPFYKTVSASQKESIGVFAPSYTKDEYQALIEIGEGKVISYLQKNEQNYADAVKTFREMIIENASLYNVSKVRLNGEILNISGAEEDEVDDELDATASEAPDSDETTEEE